MSDRLAGKLPRRRVRFSAEERTKALNQPTDTTKAPRHSVEPPDISKLRLQDPQAHLDDSTTGTAFSTSKSPCDDCTVMLYTCLPLFSYVSPEYDPNRSSLSNHDRGNSYENYLSVHSIEHKSDDCEFCDLLLRICRGADGLFLFQSKAYEDDSFNPIRQYDENGVSDHEAAHIVQGRRKRTNMKLRAEFHQAQANAKRSKLEIRLKLELWTQKREWISYGQPLIEIHKLLPIFLLPSESSKGLSITAGINHDYRPGPSEKLQMISSWVRREMRAPTTSMTDFPTRLLHFVARDRVRLVQYLDLIGGERFAAPYNASEIPHIPYAALSHRWGTSDHFTATTQNWQELQNDFPIWRLPKTFRDAILLTQQIGLRYLWIDALCILQDSSSDWLYESERMGDIYLNAAFTIAVHSTRDDAEGFLTEALSKRTAITHEFGVDTIGVCLPPDFHHDVTNSGLSRRGWVLQERFLSERTIHFTSGQVYLESEGGVFSEDGTLIASTYGTGQAPAQDQPFRTPTSSRRLFSPHDLPVLRRDMKYSARTVLSSSDGIPIVTLDGPNLDRTTLEWLNLVEMYSPCSLTYEADKLIAISGIARKVQNTTKQTWCAGIWADHICEGLLWAPTASGMAAPNYARAPSWSWASWDGPIQFPTEVWDPTFRQRCSFEAVQSLASDQPTAWLDDRGTLTLRGRLISLSQSRFSGCVSLGPGPPRRGILDDLPNVAWRHYLLGHGIFALADDVTFEDNTSLKRRRSKPSGWAIFDHMHTQLSYSDMKNRDNPTKFHDIPESFLVLGTYTIGAEILCLGLLLARSATGADGIYKRLGIGHVDWRKACPDPKNLEDIFDEAGLTLVTIE